MEGRHINRGDDTMLLSGHLPRFHTGIREAAREKASAHPDDDKLTSGSFFCRPQSPGVVLTPFFTCSGGLAT